MAHAIHAVRDAHLCFVPIWVQVQKSLNNATQADNTVKKAYVTLAFISWGMEYRNL